MQINFWLEWFRQGKRLQSEFKNPHKFALFEEYIERIAKFVPVKVGKCPENEVLKANTALLICELPKNINKTSISNTPYDLSSEALATKIESWRLKGVPNLIVAVGPADGWSAQHKTLFEKHKQKSYWTISSLTFPHELAAVLVSEQIYRALTIINGTPYHCGH